MLRVVLLVGLFGAAFSCTCLDETRKEAYCKASFVGVFTLLNKTVEHDDVVFGAKVVRVFKGSLLSGSVVKLKTPWFSGMCGIPELPLGVDYLLTGRSWREEFSTYWCGQIFQGPWKNAPGDVKAALENGGYQPCV